MVQPCHNQNDNKKCMYVTLSLKSVHVKHEEQEVAEGFECKGVISLIHYKAVGWEAFDSHAMALFLKV